MTHTEPKGTQSAGKQHAVAQTERTLSPHATQSTARFDERASRYTLYSAIQRDMAAWLAQWLDTDDAPDSSNTAPNTEHHNWHEDKTHTEKSDLQGVHTHGTHARYTNSRALDLGAGDGTFTRFLTQRCAHVSALDSAPQMLHEGARHLPQVQWLRGDAWTLEPLCDAVHTFDLITSASLLQWMHAPQETLAHWASLCPTGTRMLHGFYAEPTLCQWRKLFGQSDSLQWRDCSLWLQTFANAGWKIIRSEYDPRQYRFANSMELARSLHGTGAIAHAGQLGSGRFRALLKEYDRCYSINADTCTQPLHTFSKEHKNADCTNGVFASWGFFRIEAVRA